MSFICTRCNKKFTRQDRLLQHMNRIVPCKAASDEQSTINVRELRDTLLQRINEKKKVECDRCGSKFSSKKSMKQHQKKTCINQNDEQFFILPLKEKGYFGETCGHRIGLSTEKSFFLGEILFPVTQPSLFLEEARKTLNLSYELKAKDVYHGRLYDLLTTLTQLRETLQMKPTLDVNY